uniref:Uncharacterized protein n=1 Tax=Neogobius melanostomus TaxID=47308 RepID=A0A8C6UCH9_9GOBI
MKDIKPAKQKDLHFDSYHSYYHGNRTCPSVPTVKNGFKQGMKLEGIDPQHPSMYFVLTVVCGYRLRLHFDGYSDCHDFWVNANSSDIHPTGWCEATDHKLHTPKGQTLPTTLRI